MQRTRKRRITFTVLCVIPLTASAAQGLQPRPPQSALGAKPPQDKNAPIFMEADRPKGHSEQEIDAEGNVRLRRLDETFTADWLRYEPPTEQLAAEGTVHAERGTDTIDGDRPRYT